MQRKGTQRGFTLIEIMVALMIFAIVCVVALAALVKILDANKKAQTIQDSVVNLSFTMESLSREVRAGSKLYCTVLGSGDLAITSIAAQTDSGCGGGLSGSYGAAFAFYSNRAITGCAGLINAYEIVSNGSGGYTMKKAMQTSCGQALAFQPIVDTSNVTLTNYFLYMTDNAYPLLYIMVDGLAGSQESTKTRFVLQTAASMRLP